MLQPDTAVEPRATRAGAGFRSILVPDAGERPDT